MTTPFDFPTFVTVASGVRANDGRAVPPGTYRLFVVTPVTSATGEAINVWTLHDASGAAFDVGTAAFRVLTMPQFPATPGTTTT